MSIFNENSELNELVQEYAPYGINPDLLKDAFAKYMSLKPDDIHLSDFIPFYIECINGKMDLSETLVSYIEYRKTKDYYTGNSNDIRLIDYPLYHMTCIEQPEIARDLIHDALEIHKSDFRNKHLKFSEFLPHLGQRIYK